MFHCPTISLVIYKVIVLCYLAVTFLEFTSVRNYCHFLLFWYALYQHLHCDFTVYSIIYIAFLLICTLVSLTR